MRTPLFADKRLFNHLCPFSIATFPLLDRTKIHEVSAPDLLAMHSQPSGALFASKRALEYFKQKLCLKLVESSE